MARHGQRKPPPRKSLSETFLRTWPATARIAGLVIGVVEIVGQFAGRDPSPEILAFAGALLVAPNIAGAQDRRNDRRGD